MKKHVVLGMVLLKVGTEGARALHLYYLLYLLFSLEDRKRAPKKENKRVMGF
jgi:hypothetical protein